MVTCWRRLAWVALWVASPAYALDGGLPDAGDAAPADLGDTAPALDTRTAAPLDGGAWPTAGGPEVGPEAWPPPAPTPGPEPVPAAPSPARDVVVSASRPASRDRTQDATIIQGDRVRESTRSTLFDVLSQEAADVYVPGRGIGLHGVANGATGGIKIRGLGGSPNTQVLIVEDGVPDYQGIFGHPIPDAYLPHLLKDVLVVKGGDSTLYGTNAMAGVVVLRNRWAKRDGLELEVDSGYGSYRTLRQSLSALGRTGAWNVAGGLTVFATEGHRDGAGGGSMAGTAALRYRFTPGLCLTLRNKVVHVQGGDPGTTAHPMVDHWFDVWRDTASAQLVYSAGKLRLTATPYLNVGVHRLYDGFYSRDYLGGGTTELEARLHSAASLLLGLAADRVDGRVEDRVAGESEAVRAFSSAAVYGQVTVRPWMPLTIVLGSRALLSSAYGLVPLYKAGARWDMGRGFYVHGRVSRNFRQPTMRELYLPYPVANPDLKPEYAVSSELGAGYLTGRLDIAVTGYRTEARDLIKYFGAWPTAEVVNLDHVVIRGVEGRVAVRHLGPLSALLAAGFQDVGRYTRQNPDAKVNFTLDAEQRFGSHHLAASLSGEWVHGLYMADYARYPLANVFFMDLALRYRHEATASVPWLHSLEPYILLRNFLDRRYAYVGAYIPGTNEVATYTMPGFNVFAGLRLTL
jgi:outer membrane cobalamin receptor